MIESSFSAVSHTDVSYIPPAACQNYPRASGINVV